MKPCSSEVCQSRSDTAALPKTKFLASVGPCLHFSDCGTMAVAVPVVRVCVSMTDIMTDLIQTATLVFHLSSYDFERLSSLLRILDRQCNTKCCRTRCKSDKWHVTNRTGHFCERQQNDELLAG